MKKITAYLLIALVSCTICCLNGCVRKDTCEEQGLYGDGHCDDWCPKPDPDCGNITTTTINGGGGSSVLGDPCSSNAACGSDGLCIGDWPDGYCTKECSSDQDCAGQGWCYTLNSGQGKINICLDACITNAECRNGYTCQGDSGATVCYPGESSGPTTTIPGGGGGGYTNADLKGCYGKEGTVETFRYQFDGLSTFSWITYNPVSGSAAWGGQYQVSGNQLQLLYDDGTEETHNLFISPDKSYIKIDDTNYLLLTAGPCPD
jgi:hypothetical protein